MLCSLSAIAELLVLFPVNFVMYSWLLVLDSCWKNGDGENIRTEQGVKQLQSLTIGNSVSVNHCKCIYIFYVNVCVQSACHVVIMN